MSVQNFKTDILEAIASACRELGADVDASQIALNPVPENQFGDIAMTCFTLRGKLSALDPKALNNPAAISQALAEKLSASPLFEGVKACGPYLNMAYNTSNLAQIVVGEILQKGDHFGDAEKKNKKVVIEFSGPNTNKPQHLGHLRNNVIGESMSRLLAKSGYDVTKVNIINDRGVHICKSMLVYMKYGDGITPESAGKKGDHLVGDFYVRFEKEFQAEYKEWLESEEGQQAFEEYKSSDAGKKAQKAIDDYAKIPEEKRKGKAPADLFASFKADTKDKYFNTKSKLGAEATDLLVRWEAGDPEVRRIWKLLNTWVIDGFLDTYKTLGIEFDKLYYESNTYKLGKDIIEDGLKRGIFHHLPDNATAFDLSRIGLSGEKIVLRSNGTSVYITQDIGTAIERYKDYAYDKMIYVVADEQNHHFRVLFGILGELRPELAGRFEHLSYGMVTLPNGRMKSREGTVVDTDDLIEEMARLVREVMDNKSDREHYADADEAEFSRRAMVIALAALKYFLLNITPTSWMEFNPEKSLDLQGRTGAYCLMNYARTRSILRKAGYTHQDSVDPAVLAALRTPEEKKVLMTLMQCPDIIKWATESSDPAKIAEYLFNLCKSFAFIFTDKAGHPILTCEDPALRAARLALVDALGTVLRMGLGLLGIETLEEM
ncbi:MAG: arginine--tRNA ligase [Proteobacteria bacterium]|nr:arginine--tRNA ligase [Pseudomonadota bacterium]